MSPTTITTTSDSQPYDEAMITPDGWRYRADFPQYNLPPIQQDNEIIGEPTNRAQITYRCNMESKAGETRTNIFYIDLLDVSMDFPTTPATGIHVTLIASNIPNGIIFTQDGEGDEGAGWKLREELVHIQIAADAKPGEYTFQVTVNIDGIDYGQVPCTIKVIQ